jgi:uncharacterized protein YbjT (DUF2867 family)
MANHRWNEGTVLVLGGTGKTGRRVGERLKTAGRNVRLGSRRGDPAFDWENRDTWALALNGISAVYVSYQPDLAVPGAIDTVGAFFAKAIHSGVGKIVLLSGRGEPEAEEAEDVLQATNADWTILRSSWFSQNFSENFFLEPILAGETALPEGLAAEPFVDVEDIADIAVAAFNDPRHSIQLYDITGPKALTFAEAIDAIAQTTGRKIDYLPVSPADYRAELVRQKVPEEFVELVMYLFTTVLDGRNTPLGDGVERALGRQPRSFADYVKTTAATGVWGDYNA